MITYKGNNKYFKSYKTLKELLKEEFITLVLM